MKRNSGITLIALVITIIVLLILAGITINLAINSGGIFDKANEAKFKARMAEHKETVDIYVADKMIENQNSNTKGINAGETLKEAIIDETIQDITLEDVNTELKDILKRLSREEKRYIVVYEGVMHYVSMPTIKNNEKYKEWCIDIGIPILEYSPPTGIDIRDGSYQEVNGIYVCTPDMTQGFEKSRTRYLDLGPNGKMRPGNWVTYRPDPKWYDYKEQKWANIYIENAGQELYYVWIPRYCYKLDQTTQRSIVEFIDVNNEYKDKDGKVTTWEERIAKDPSWEIPEAFKFNDKQIPGYWMSKYTLGDNISPTTINFEMSVMKGEVTLKNIKTNNEITANNPIASYTVALNGKIIKKITDATKVKNITSETIKFSNLRRGNNIINVTGLNSDGEIVGSMTKEYDSPVVNEPDLSKFDKETTFYVTYDSKGNEHSTIPISKPAPSEWYDYGSSQWANIVTRNNEEEAYFVWIPRYQYKLDQANERSMVRFLNGTSKQKEAGYEIPEAFTFNGQELTGYWMSKYTLGDEIAPIFSTETTATNTTIKTNGIIGTGVKDGLTYNYYLNGEKKASKTTATESYLYEGLSANTFYTINIEIRETQSDKYVGSVTKKVKTQSANAPDLTGFNPDVTYYVLYDGQGNQKIGNKINKNGSNAPKNWYDYSERRWANIVVKSNNAETYYTWIPRYEYKITKAQSAQPANGRTDINFIQGTGNTKTTGYEIPEAFKFNGQELTGYWMSKYTLGE